MSAAEPAIYAEDRSGVRWTLYVAHIVAGVVMMPVCIVAGTVPGLGGLAGLTAVGFFWALFGVSFLNAALTVGIRVDGREIAIGGIRGRERRQRSGNWPPRRGIRVGTQGRAVFTCPWRPGVQALYLVTDRRQLKPLYRQRRRFVKTHAYRDLRDIPLGLLSTAWMKAALVIVHDPSYATTDPPGIRSSTTGQGPLLSGVTSATWLVPVRDPEALRAALARVPDAPEVVDGLRTGMIFTFEPER